VATPVAAREALARIRAEAGWVEAIEIPDRFNAVGAHYVDFEPVADDALVRALAFSSSPA
jgi:putative phosphoribosyl transferase